jgi:potassium-transporting ATPase KdpC subunit
MKDLYALWRHSLAGLRVLIAAIVICGLAYPLLVTGIAQVTMPWRADGSLITATGAHTTDPAQAVGSALLGQLDRGPDAVKYFYPRPSAAGDGYDPTASYGTNYGPNDPRLLRSIRKAQQKIAAREGVPVSAVPADAVTSSGSGLDPDISPAYAAIQVARVARENGLSVAAVQALVRQNTHGRAAGVLGDPHVNVLRLDIAVKQAAAGAH